MSKTITPRPPAQHRPRPLHRPQSATRWPASSGPQFFALAAWRRIRIAHVETGAFQLAGWACPPPLPGEATVLRGELP